MTKPKTTYKVTAKTGYRGHAEGEEFDADLTDDEERRAKARGSIRVVSRNQSGQETDEKERGDNA